MSARITPSENICCPPPTSRQICSYTMGTPGIADQNRRKNDMQSGARCDRTTAQDSVELGSWRILLLIIKVTGPMILSFTKYCDNLTVIFNRAFSEVFKMKLNKEFHCTSEPNSRFASMSIRIRLNFICYNKILFIRLHITKKSLIIFPITTRHILTPTNSVLTNIEILGFFCHRTDK